MVPTGSGTVMGGAGGAPSAMVSKGSGPGGRHRLWFPQDQGQWWEGRGGAPSVMFSKGSGPGGRHRLWFPQDQGQWWEGRGPSSATSKPGALVAYASSPGGRLHQLCVYGIHP